MSIDFDPIPSDDQLAAIAKGEGVNKSMLIREAVEKLVKSRNEVSSSRVCWCIPRIEKISFSSAGLLGEAGGAVA